MNTNTIPTPIGISRNRAYGNPGHVAGVVPVYLEGQQFPELIGIRPGKCLRIVFYALSRPVDVDFMGAAATYWASVAVGTADKQSNALAPIFNLEFLYE